jgi:hypothetical protein
MSATLNTTILLQQIIDAFKTRLAPLNALSLDLSGPAVKFGDTVRAGIRQLPTVRSYDATTGYRANAADAKDLVVDVPVTINQHKHVPIKFDHEDLHRAERGLAIGAAADAGYILAKDVLDYALGLVTVANVSASVNQAAIDVGFDTLETIRTLGNTRRMGAPRYGIVNSTTAASLSNDSRIFSRDVYSGQDDGAEPLRVFRAVAGFREIWEYPELPVQGGDLLAGIFFDPRLVAVAMRPVQNPTELVNALGVPASAQVTPMTDPDTGLTLSLITYQEPGTLDLIMTVAAMYGASVGTRGGSADTVTDRAGIRLSNDMTS